MESEREAQANDRTEEKGTEHNFFLKLDLDRWTRQEVSSDADERNTAEQVGPDVSGFSVHAEHGFEARPERWQRRTVVAVQEVVVLQPFR